MFDKNVSFLRKVFLERKTGGEKKPALFRNISSLHFFLFVRDGDGEGGFHGHGGNVLGSFHGSRWHFDAGDLVRAS